MEPGQVDDHATQVEHHHVDRTDTSHVHTSSVHRADVHRADVHPGEATASSCTGFGPPAGQTSTRTGGEPPLPSGGCHRHRNCVAFLGASLALLLVPGPSVLFVVSRGVALGRRAAITTVLGNSSGSLVHVVAVALGVGAIVQRSVVVFNVLKFAGALYLVYLGIVAIARRRGFTA